MKKLFKTSIEQTGIAVLSDNEGREKLIPLFSNNPCEEARGIIHANEVIGDYKLKDVFYSNNLLDYKIEDLINTYYKRNKYLPENYVEELVSGFPFIFGRTGAHYTYCYS